MLAVAALAAAVLSCGKNTQLSGRLHEGAGEEVVVKLLDVNRFQVLDTVKVDDNGNFSYALDMEEGKPEFIYLFHGERQIASLLLQKGDKVQVETDTLGAYSVEGSEESDKLQKVENAYQAFQRDMARPHGGTGAVPAGESLVPGIQPAHGRHPHAEYLRLPQNRVSGFALCESP